MDSTHDEIARVLRADEGMSLSDVRARLGSDLSDRQLRYRLQALIDSGRARAEGERRWRRYYAGGAAEDFERQSSTIFGTSAAVLVRTARGPRSARPPAQYVVELIDAYEPNVSRLLPADVCDRLVALGRTPRAAAAAGTFAREVMERLVIDLSWASSSLEGNTYTLLDTRRLIEHGEAADGKDLRETQMILNHKRAIEFLVDDVEELVPRARVVANLHAILMENLLHDPGDGGRVRQKAVGITGSTYTPVSNPQRLQELFHRVLALAREIDDPLEMSLFLFVHIAYLQPFIDGNKRTARLAGNIPLIRSNMRPLTFLDVPRDDYLSATLAMYETGKVDAVRDLWVWAYERSCARYADVLDLVVEPDPFRLRHRDTIFSAVREVVATRPSDGEAHVEAMARDAFEDASDRARFIGFVMADLASLHDGNFMRYRITPTEFEAWDSVV